MAAFGQAAGFALMDTTEVASPSIKRMRAMKTTAGFRVGVESVLPGADDWFASIYGCWFGKYFTEEHLGTALREVGAQFTLFYDSLAPRKPDACRRIADMCARLRLPFLFNNTYGDIQGPWVRDFGRAEYTPEQLAYAAATGLFLGVIWDEVEHRQLHQYDMGTNGPYFFDARGLSVTQCYDRMVESVREVTERYGRSGAASVAELVFPVSMHSLARAGMIPAPKLLKESYGPLVLAIAMGAALQYGCECWAVLDLWGVRYFWGSRTVCTFEGGNPGHNTDEYRSALLLGYWMGLDAVYTEGLYNLIVPIHTTPEEWAEIRANPIRHRGTENPLVTNYRKKGYVLTEYGKWHRWFVRHYLPAHPRPFTFRDIRPEVAVIALPDTTWCRRDSATGFGSRQILFGPGGPAKEARHEALIDVVHVLTHGKVSREGLAEWASPEYRHHEEIRKSMDGFKDPCEYPYDDTHTGFCPLNGVVFFDHLVDEPRLKDIPLLICVGETLSESTSQAIRRCVQRGAKCLALPHLFPDLAAAQPKRGDSAVISQGRGSMLLTDDVDGEAARAFVAPHLDAPDVVRYRFGDHEIRLSPLAGDERRLGMTMDGNPS
jgi:hypothetical protein